MGCKAQTAAMARVVNDADRPQPGCAAREGLVQRCPIARRSEGCWPECGRATGCARRGSGTQHRRGGQAQQPSPSGLGRTAALTRALQQGPGQWEAQRHPRAPHPRSGCLACQPHSQHAGADGRGPWPERQDTQARIGQSSHPPTEDRGQRPAQRRQPFERSSAAGHDQRQRFSPLVPAAPAGPSQRATPAPAVPVRRAACAGWRGCARRRRRTSWRRCRWTSWRRRARRQTS
jgi:hypothetical protein